MLLIVRNIQNLLHFRTDISPFLVHLTRQSSDKTARDNLVSILDCEALIASGRPISDARYAAPMKDAADEKLFGAISFSETPISEVHTLFEIGSRTVKLEPYGLVFLKQRLARRGVSPVIYINNEQEDQDQVVAALVSLRTTHRAAAERILPLVSVFGGKLKPLGGTHQGGRVDFTWEREWRYPASSGYFDFTREDIFIGLCPHEDIPFFQRHYPRIGFIDPRRNVKWYAAKLIKSRKRLQLKYSVV